MLKNPVNPGADHIFKSHFQLVLQIWKRLDPYKKYFEPFYFVIGRTVKYFSTVTNHTWFIFRVHTKFFMKTFGSQRKKKAKVYTKLIYFFSKYSSYSFSHKNFLKRVHRINKMNSNLLWIIERPWQEQKHFLENWKLDNTNTSLTIIGLVNLSLPSS